jgi:Domain of unknown function (DUF4126)
MLELLTGTGLAVAAGLNAYIPMLIVGLGARFLDFITLPAGWSWLENEWVLGILGVLLVIEVIADKIPVVDTINDWIQTIVRPAAGGIVFGAGSSSATAVVQDPGQFFTSGSWVPVAVGIVLALVVHAGKAFARPAVNAMTLGVGAPVVSTIEDASSVVMSILAILAPVLVILGIGGLVWALVALFRRAARRRRERAAANPAL